MKTAVGCLLILFGLFCAFTVGSLLLGAGGGLIAVGLAVMWLHRQGRRVRRKPGWS